MYLVKDPVTGAIIGRFYNLADARIRIRDTRYYISYPRSNHHDGVSKASANDEARASAEGRARHGEGPSGASGAGGQGQWPAAPGDAPDAEVNRYGRLK